MHRTIDMLHHSLSGRFPKPMSFTPEQPFLPQKEALRQKYQELLQMPAKDTTAKAHVVWTKSDDPRFDEWRIEIETEKDFFVPAHMLLPKGLSGSGKKLPAVLCLQGHSTGMHISLGRVLYPRDEESIHGGDRDFALQAVARGYIAVAMEQRGFGELKSAVEHNSCQQAAMHALMVGRTLQGERIHDCMCMVDALLQMPFVDGSRIAVMGNSGGGTTAYHAACIDERIRVVMPSCAFNTYEASILSMAHCTCNYVPGISSWFEMPDLALCIAPRPLLIVSGQKDAIFPIDSAKSGFATVQAIYKAAGAAQNCRHIIGSEGHRFYADDAWPVFDQYI